MSTRLTSTQNPRVKQVVRLRERRERERSGLMLVEGGDELALALAGGARPRTLFICPEFAGQRHAALLAGARSAAEEVVEVSAAVFEKMSYRDNPDGWLAVFPVRQHGLDTIPSHRLPLLLVAETIEKPGNLGALLRSADAAGASGLIVCDPATDISNPNVIRSSRGTLFTLPIAIASSQAAIEWLRENGIAIIAATPQANLNYTEADLRGPVAIAVGAEHQGLSSAWLNQADVAVRIPMRGQVNSLNVATAATLLLYEAVRQRQHAG
jgi:RNA methyltransferase, TrmH family